jgi:nondiscriminating aspartyl-tRNA synthetase
MGPVKRIFIQSIPNSPEQPVLLRGWVQRLRVLGKTTFLVLKDCSGQAQCIVASELLKNLRLKSEDTVEIKGRVRLDSRAPGGFEVAIISARVLNRARQNLPFTSSSDIHSVALESLIDYRPLALRNPAVGNIFRVQAALLAAFRRFLNEQRFTEIITSKLVASGTEGGTNLFELKYFDRVAYLAQSPQFYKEHGVAGFERVYETGHVYRAEPHATSRHLTEYYSLDVEFGFIEGPEDVIQLERELLTHMFETLNVEMADTLAAYRTEPLPSILSIPCWEFSDCLELLRTHCNRTDLRDDLDPEAERQLCRLAQKETGIPAVFFGIPARSPPFLYGATR